MILITTILGIMVHTFFKLSLLVLFTISICANCIGNTMNDVTIIKNFIDSNKNHIELEFKKQLIAFGNKMNQNKSSDSKNLDFHNDALKLYEILSLRENDLQFVIRPIFTSEYIETIKQKKSTFELDLSSTFKYDIFILDKINGDFFICEQFIIKDPKIPISMNYNSSISIIKYLSEELNNEENRAGFRYIKYFQYYHENNIQYIFTFDFYGRFCSWLIQDDKLMIWSMCYEFVDRHGSRAVDSKYFFELYDLCEKQRVKY